MALSLKNAFTASNVRYLSFTRVTRARRQDFTRRVAINVFKDDLTYPTGQENVKGTSQSYTGLLSDFRKSNDNVSANDIPPPYASSKPAKRKKEKNNFKLPNFIKCETLDDGDSRFGQMIMKSRSQKSRHDEGIILLEGSKLITAAIEAGVQIQSLFFDRFETLKNLPVEDFTAKYYKVKNLHMDIWSTVKTEYLMAICSLPTKPVDPNPKHVLPVTLLLEHVKDPHCMAMLLKSASEIKCDRVITTPDCVDIWDTKVIQAAEGSHFNTQIYPNLGWERIARTIPDETSVVMPDIRNVNNTSNHIKEFSYERIKSIKPSICTDIDEKNGEEYELDSNFLDKSIVNLFQNVPIVQENLFSSAAFADRGHTTIVLSGKGCFYKYYSNKAKKLAYDKAGKSVYIPAVKSGLNSLNTEIAGSLVMFELKRQLVNVNSEHGEVV